MTRSLIPSLRVSRSSLRETWVFVYVDGYGRITVSVPPPPGATAFTLSEPVLHRAAELIRDEIRDGTARGERRWEVFCAYLRNTPFTFHT